jgi:predicted nuclease with TOPRIM domain
MSNGVDFRKLALGLREELDRVQAENQALQELLNQRDEANHDLEQRRHAEQQACQAAERRVEELEGLLNTALLAMKRIYQAGRDFIVGTGSDCDSVELMMENDPTAREIRAALNPTAEAASERAEDDRWLQMKDDAERAEYNDHEE